MAYTMLIIQLMIISDELMIFVGTQLKYCHYSINNNNSLKSKTTVDNRDIVYKLKKEASNNIIYLYV